MAKGLLSGPGIRLINDFLEMVDDYYPQLTPYKRLATCRDNASRLERRCRMILEGIAGSGALLYLGIGRMH